jgi:hypothetical protein
MEWRVRTFPRLKGGEAGSACQRALSELIQPIIKINKLDNSSAVAWIHHLLPPGGAGIEFVFMVKVSGPIKAVENLAMTYYAGVAQLAEHQPSKLRVAGSIPVSRSIVIKQYC